MPRARPGVTRAPRVVTRAPRVVRAAVMSIVLATVLVACGAGSEPVVAPAAPVGPAGDASGGASVSTPASVAIVLPPADGLADVERVRVRMLVERAADEALPGEHAPVLLAPATADALALTVESAVRRVGTSGTVCLIGGDSAAALADVAALYPATRLCRLLGGGASDGASGDVGSGASGSPASLFADVDLDRLGRELGAAARAAAGPGTTVLVLAGGDAMLDRRWRDGIVTGVAGSAHTVTRASEALALVDAQAESLAAGVVPASPAAFGAAGSAPFSDPLDRDDLPLALTLPTIAVVVLDASPEAALLVGPLVERGMLVVGPRSLLIGLPDGPNDPRVVLRWRVRWDVLLTALLRRVGSAPGSAELELATQPAWEDMVVLEPGPAHVTP